jgi:hypothetical protein
MLFERRNDGTFVLSQRQYLLNILQQFNVPKKMMDAQNADTIDATFPFREAVGSLLYLSNHTSPDTSFAVGILGRATAAPSAHDVVAVKRLLRYLSETRGYGLLLGETGESTLIAYSDADWGGDVDRKSISGALH